MNGTIISNITRSDLDLITTNLDNTKQMITSEETNPSSHAYQQGNYLIYNNNLYKVISAIEIGDTLTVGTNISLVNVGEELKATAGSSGGGGETISAPSLVTNIFTYDGTSKSPIFTGFDEDTMIYGNNIETNAGQYAMSVALMNGNNVWSDTDDNAPKSYLWTIQKAQAVLSVSANAVTLDTEHPSVDITVTLTGDGTISITNSDDSVCSTSMDGTTCTITATTHLLKTATLTFSANETSNWLAPADVTVDVTAAYAKIVSWAEGTDEEIVTLIDLADNGYINLYRDCGWRVGDTRVVPVSAMTSYSMPAQDIELVLMHWGSIPLTTPTAGGNTYCSFVVGMKDVFVDSSGNAKKFNQYYDTNTYASYQWSYLRTFCNNYFKSYLPVTLSGIFKQFKLKYVRDQSTTTLGEFDEWFALPTEKNVMGTRNYSLAADYNIVTNVHFSWYQTADNRIKRDKNGSMVHYWTSSVTSTTYDFCYITGNSPVSTYQDRMYNQHPWSVFGVI